jgi:hypothetical protein
VCAASWPAACPASLPIAHALRAYMFHSATQLAPSCPRKRALHVASIAPRPAVVSCGNVLPTPALLPTPCPCRGRYSSGHDSKHAADGSSNTISLLSEDDSDNDATTKASKQPRDAASGGVQAPQASATRPFNEEQQNALHVLLVLMQTTKVVKTAGKGTRAPENGLRAGQVSRGRASAHLFRLFRRLDRLFRLLAPAVFRPQDRALL